jgi:hypothetical protein
MAHPEGKKKFEQRVKILIGLTLPLKFQKIFYRRGVKLAGEIRKNVRHGKSVFLKMRIKLKSSGE